MIIILTEHCKQFHVKLIKIMKVEPKITTTTAIIMIISEIEFLGVN